ncbi:MAG: UDP-3-O-(3-hydroxymyristoyl)glucosamine N-acyltransferase [Gammaproteobacteria bacterium]|nr:UDP-3-O-(3-hydroxymyristoyl)glucosamine N-acyltransferase [Gammaproteobacteria bacterium]
MAVTLAELARRFQGKVRGNPEIKIVGVAPLETAGANDIAYIADRKYLPGLQRSAAGAVILTQEDAQNFTGNALIVDNPHFCFAQTAELLHPLTPFTPGQHASAVVAPTARIASSAWIGPHAVIEAEAIIEDGVYVGPGCFVGAHAKLGARTRLIANVTIGERCRLDSDCLCQPGAVIGGDGFGYAKHQEKWHKVPQLGRVILGHAVEVGANTTIDRGALNDTVIGDGVKLDNLIQIAHNVRIGENTAIAACVGIAGSTVIGKRCTVGGQAGIVGHLEIADDVHITAGSLVTSSIDQAGVYSASLKAQPVEKWRRNAARLHQLDELVQRLSDLEKKLK